jgi:alkylated DNA repair dioxygenase AlkB
VPRHVGSQVLLPGRRHQDRDGLVGRRQQPPDGQLPLDHEDAEASLQVPPPSRIVQGAVRLEPPIAAAHVHDPGHRSILPGRRLTGSVPGASIEHVFPTEPPGPDEVVWQADLFASGPPSVDPTFSTLTRHQLDDACWIDHAPGWLSGGDEVFASLVRTLPWQQRRVRMYDKVLDEPRLTWWWSEASASASGEGLPETPAMATVDQARRALSAHYGVAFDSVGANFYRDGRDSVAWHRDRVDRTFPEHHVAIVSLGEPRPFLLRPYRGGRSRSYLLGPGDLLVMGGACQHRFEHTVPKVATAGPRLSVTFRHGPMRRRSVTSHPAAPGHSGRRAQSSHPRNANGREAREDAGGVRVREHSAERE